MSFALVLRYGCDKCYVIRGCNISKVVSRVTMDIIFQGTYRVPWWLLLSRVVSHVTMDVSKDMSLMGPTLRENWCFSLAKTCITVFDIAFHVIAHLDHWWTLTCVLLILWVFYCKTCDWRILSIVIEKTSKQKIREKKLWVFLTPYPNLHTITCRDPFMHLCRHLRVFIYLRVLIARSKAHTIHNNHLQGEGIIVGL